MLRILDSSTQLLIQDSGRFDHMNHGVPVSGAWDRQSMRHANFLVGNDPAAPVIECVGGNVVFECTDSLFCTITGYRAPIYINDDPYYTNELLFLRSGDRLRIGFPDWGMRGFLAIRGGVHASAVLGSVSTDLLSGIGPAPLVVGDTIAPAQFSQPWEPTIRQLPLPSAVPLKVILGPRDDWFDSATIEDFFSQDFIVDPFSNRIGVRLQAEKPLLYASSQKKSLPSEGVVRGSIQVPPDGNPVIFGPDHPITGGYPVIGVLSPEASDFTSQLTPGEKINFM